MKESLEELGEYISLSLGREILSARVAHGELIVECTRDSIVSVLTFLRDDPNCLFKLLVDICGVDWPDTEDRFEVVYNLLSLKHNQRIRVKISTNEAMPVPSAVQIYPSAGWFEREVWDMYGVLFSGNPDLRRILTDYGFDGHPLRKDFPLSGYVELRYDDERKRVVYEPVKLSQEFRNFDNLSPWEGMTEVMLKDGIAVDSNKIENEKEPDAA